MSQNQSLIASAESYVNTTFTPQSAANLWMIHRTFITAWFIIMICISIIGSAFNFLLFIVFRKPRKSLRGSQILIAHMILLDLTICACTNPLFVSSVFFTQFIPLSKTYCRIVGFLYVSSFSMENWLNLSLAINRSVALLYPTFYPKLTRKWSTIGMAAIGWVFVIPHFTGFVSLTAAYEPAPPWGSCAIRPLPRFFTMYTFDIVFPLGGAAVIYLGTFVVYKIRTRSAGGASGAGQAAPTANTSVNDRHIRTIKMLFASYLWFMLFFLPSAMLSYVFIAYARTSVTATFYGSSSTLFAYATNPVNILTDQSERRPMMT